MKFSTPSVALNEHYLDDAELAGITGGKLLIDINYLEGDSIPWTELEPARQAQLLPDSN
jgi:hypothetical protein